MKSKETFICDWCKMEYPEGTYPYWELMLFGKEYHIICDDCKEHLKQL